ncbi:SURF1 family cytochrome oxidase biogenesis protein [Sanguibacter suaedae]|uniref:SURF1-like protein n=1 Tax=Sanguibacter suaedae TaxID=2795737 RepID=A0A934MDQ3_9MICO|nr:SURF1 family protein [Sanguibacter suaedae]MBI9115004.1 SURF1 family protein [Sanguibacter suaedae]
MNERSPGRPGERTLQQWVVLALGVAALAAGCVAAGLWQWSKHETRSAAIDVVEENYGSAPVPLEELLPRPGSTVAAGDVWRPVEVRGEYVTDATVLLRNRPVDSQPSFHVLVPFRTESGGVLVVNRGWVPYSGGTAAPTTVPEPPSGVVVDIVVRLRADEAAASNGAPPGQVQAIHVDQVLAAGPDGSAWADATAYDAYGSLVSEDPAPQDSPYDLPRPDTSPGSHLSYAFQWWVFAVGGVAGVLVMLSRERRERTVMELGGLAHPFEDAPEDPEGGAAADPGGRGRRGRRGGGRPSAEDVEDSLIDARARR